MTFEDGQPVIGAPSPAFSDHLWCCSGLEFCGPAHRTVWIAVIK